MLPTRRRQKSTSAFSLLEATVTLSLIGIVTGGIWMAAAEVSENRRVEQLVAGSIIIYENVEKMYNGYIASEIDFTSGSTYDSLRTKALEGVSGYGLLADGSFSTPDPDITMEMVYSPPGILSMGYIFSKKKPGVCYKLASGLIELAGPDLNRLEVKVSGPAATISPAPGSVPMPTTTTCKKVLSMTIEFQ